ncbi:hypothetical protein HU200_050832 [Digitaria exilis]|uniref:Uncharacterized protein n=1 Tax=Digitaria exilis TaxID=1010633 RepID=A0A835AWX0_9POAL|nr:hypothetical protein HU200_050832 [Digitaria exilis]
MRNSFREEPFTSSGADTGTENPVEGRLQNKPANPSSHRKESHTESLAETISRPIKKKSRFLAGPDPYPARKVHEEHPNQADKVEDRFPNGTDAPCGDVLPGSVSTSSKKRWGHAPENLMEPRKEAGRPVLTPSAGMCTCHVLKEQIHSPFSSDRTILGSMCKMIPVEMANTVNRWFTTGTNAHQIQGLLYWKNSSNATSGPLAMKRSAKRYLTENQLDTNLFCHEKQKVRQFLAAKKARKSSTVHRARGEMELEEDYDKECPDKQQQDESMMDTRDQPNKETQCTQLGSNSVERQVGSEKCRRYCGAISVSKKAQHKLLSKSSPVCVSKQGQQPMFTKEQVQEMINQAQQGLNEAWEKKFLSLERKIPIISSLHVVPDVT